MRFGALKMANNIDTTIWRQMNSGASGGGGSVTFDDREFRRNLKKLQKQLTPKGIEQGLAQAGLQLMSDAIDEAPSVPLDESTLQGSGSVFVGNKLIGTSQDRAGGKGKPTPNRHLSGADQRQETVATVGFNTPYAARLHEHPEFAFQQNKGHEGGKFLEYKLFANGKRYFDIVAHNIKKVFSEGLPRGGA